MRGDHVATRGHEEAVGGGTAHGRLSHGPRSSVRVHRHGEVPVLLRRDHLSHARGGDAGDGAAAARTARAPLRLLRGPRGILAALGQGEARQTDGRCLPSSGCVIGHVAILVHNRRTQHEDAASGEKVRPVDSDP